MEKEELCGLEKKYKPQVSRGLEVLRTTMSIPRKYSRLNEG
jgi:hypothetical protein